MRGFSLAMIEMLFRMFPPHAVKYIHDSAAYSPSDSANIQDVIAILGRCFSATRQALEFLKRPTQLINAPTCAPIRKKCVNQNMFMMD